MRALTETPVTIISAELATLGKEENSQRTAALKVDLIKAFGSKSVKQVRGQYKGVKKVSFVVNGALYHILGYATTYDQESVLSLDTSRAAVLVYVKRDRDPKPLGRFQVATVKEALTADGYTYDISQDTYYIIK